jgi:hypothetical protein
VLPGTPAISTTDEVESPGFAVLLLAVVVITCLPNVVKAVVNPVDRGELIVVQPFIIPLDKLIPLFNDAALVW